MIHGGYEEEYSKAKLGLPITQLVESIDESTKLKSTLTDLLGDSVNDMRVGKTWRIELSGYLAEVANVTTDPDKWWNANQHKYPVLAELYKKFSPPATTVPCECLWSEAGNIVTKKRCALDTDTVCMLLYCHHNLEELERLGFKFIWE